MACIEGYSMSDVKAANTAMERWQLIQKGHSAEEADALIREAEEKAKEVRDDGAGGGKVDSRHQFNVGTSSLLTIPGTGARNCA